MYLLFDDIFVNNVETEPEVEQSPEIEVDETTGIINLLEAQPVTVENYIRNKEMYEPIIYEISKALTNHYNFSQLRDNNLSDLLYYYTPDTLGYTFLDINGDGLDELLIGQLEYPTSWMVSLYYIKDDSVSLAFHGGEREYYKLCTDGLFCYSGSSGADSTSLLTFELTSYGLIVVNDDREKDYFNLTDEYFTEYEPLSAYIYG